MGPPGNAATFPSLVHQSKKAKAGFRHKRRCTVKVSDPEAEETHQLRAFILQHAGRIYMRIKKLKRIAKFQRSSEHRSYLHRELDLFISSFTTLHDFPHELIAMELARAFPRDVQLSQNGSLEIATMCPSTRGA